MNRAPKPKDLPRGNSGPGFKSGSLPYVGPDKRTAAETPGCNLLLAQEDLRWSEKRYHKIFEHSEDGIIVLDAQQHTILDLNQSMADMSGYSRDELLSRPITDIWPDKLNQVVDLALSLTDGRQVSGISLACELKDGRQIQMEISASLIDFDRWPSILCMVRDNTEHKQAEEERERLQEKFARSESMLTSIVTAIPDIIYRLDPEGKITFVNDAVRQYGYEPKELDD